MMPPMRPPVLGFLVLLLAPCLLGARDVRSFNLQTMLTASEGAVAGRIESRSVREATAADGGLIYFTTLRVVGTDLASGESRSVDVVYVGGFLDAERGSFSSTAPPSHQTVVGREVVAFHHRSDDLGGGFGGEALVGGRSGLFTTFRSRKGASIVQGRGAGHAVERNLTLEDLRAQVLENQ